MFYNIADHIEGLADYMQFTHMGAVRGYGYGGGVVDKKGAALTRNASAECVQHAIQAFMQVPYDYKNAVLKRDVKKLQAFGVSTDFEVLTKDSFNVTIESDNFDLGYEMAFKGVPVGAGQDKWEIYDVQSGLSFRKIEEGGRIKIDGMSGTVVQAGTDYYGGAIGFTDQMIRFRKVAAMLSLATEFRNKFWTNKAANHYTLLAAAGALPANIIAQQGVAADGVTRRNLLTINEAAFQLGDRNKDKGYGDTATAELIIYANPGDEAAIEAAFVVTAAQLVGSRENGTPITKRRIRRIYTFNSAIAPGAPLMILPGQKMQKADIMSPTTFRAPIDPLTLMSWQSVWAIYGAVIADTDQVVKFTIVR